MPNFDLKTFGDFELVPSLASHDHVFAYTRRYHSSQAIVLLNFGDEQERLVLQEGDLERIGEVTGFRLALGNYTVGNSETGNRKELKKEIVLDGWQGVVYIK